MSQQSFKERMGISSNENNPEIINEVPYNEKIFNKEILTEDHIDNYSIGHDVSKKIEVDITNLEKPLKITQSKHSIDNKGSSSKSNIIE